jgi:hypothetical protein
MPSAAAILDGLGAAANDWRAVAVAWHALLGALLCGLWVGWRPSKRFAGALLCAPLVSVAALAWVGNNPFNGTAFAALSLALAAVALRFPPAVVDISSPTSRVVGAILIAFGWGYPHFLQTQSSVAYLYAAPLGVLPCPTLSAVLGTSLLLNLFNSQSWSVLLSFAAVVYGLFGAFGLGVGIDLVLLAGGIALAIAGHQ